MRVYIYIFFLWAQVNLTVAIWAPVKVDLQRAAIEKKSPAAMERMKKGSGWEGSLHDAADGLELLFSNGKLNYPARASDAADEAWFILNAPGLQQLFRKMPKLNGKYSTFVKAILSLMESNKYGRGFPHLKNK